MFQEYLKRQLYGRKNLLKFLNMKKSTYYRHINNPDSISIGEFKLMIKVGELDEQRVINWLYGREK